MYLRTKILPRAIQDIAATFFLICMIPITFWFEIYVVVPEVHGAGTLIHLLFFILGFFLLFNITSNLIALMVTDTSTRPYLISPPYNAQEKGWNLCGTCEALAPPRSWHCPVCDVCVLKRDHHCIFSGCCIGFHNHRYFIMVVTYLFISTTISTLYNSYYIWFLHAAEFRHLLSVVKILFPLAVFLIDSTTNQYYLVIYLINLVGCLFTGVLLIYHANLISNGMLVHEKNKKISISYDLGSKIENWKIVFGEKYHIAWLSPFIQSEIKHDGIHWDAVLLESGKNR